MNELLVIATSKLTTNLLINTIKRSSFNINYLLNYFNSSKDVNIQIELQRMDVMYKLKLNDTLLNEIKINDKESIQFVIKELKIVINMIQKELNAMFEKVKFNNSLFILSSYRSYSFKKHLENLKIFTKLLDTRYNDLIKITSIKDEIVIQTDSETYYELSIMDELL